MAETDNEITPVPQAVDDGPAANAELEGIILAVQYLMVENSPTQPLPGHEGLQSEWPPAYLGHVPSSSTPPLQMKDLETVDSRTKPSSLPSDALVNKKETNPLLSIWSADLRRYGEHEYLVLPPTVNGAESYWRHEENLVYPSDKLLARKSYAKAFSNIYKAHQETRGRGRLIALGGTSGIGKSLFNLYVIWRLFHPDGGEVTVTPRTILYCPDAKDQGGYLFHEGKFYTVNSVGGFLATNGAANMFDGQTAWMIADGAPPSKVYHCPVLVSSSPGNFQLGDQKGAKKFFKCADKKVFLPPWSREEIWTVARVVYNIIDDDDETLQERFRVFGGIPRSVLKDYNEHFTISKLFNITDVATALAEVGSEEMNHSKVSGKILHLVPDNTLTYPRYEWASNCIMEAAFHKLFQMTRKKIESFLNAGYGLHLGTFYGLMFEPYYHATITERGYNGKIRRLTPPPSTDSPFVSQQPGSALHPLTPPILPATHGSEASVKRNWYGAKKHWAQPYDSKIPRLPINHFHVLSDIAVSCYNVPDRKNFAAVDAIAPSRGEMYQVTSAERHGIKGLHLRPLKRFFAGYLSSGQKVKLIFVVPPNRFESYQEQKYLFPPVRISDDDEGDDDKQKRKRKRKMGENFDIIDWDDLPYVEDVEVQDVQVQPGVPGADNRMRSKKKLQDALLAEVTEWIDQYVMEMSVEPMASSAAVSVRIGLKKLTMTAASSTTTTTTAASTSVTTSAQN